MSISPADAPDALPYRLDTDRRRVLMLRMSAAARTEAAFLDARGMPVQPEGAWLSFDAFLARSAQVSRAQLDWIFHIGHCGSTLLARVLEAWSQVGVLREPLPLRTMATMSAATTEDDWQALLRGCSAMWSQPLAPAARVAIKATSSCNALIAPILTFAPGDRAVLLDLPLRAWLATLFKSPDSIRDATASAPARWTELCTHSGVMGSPPLPTADDAELCAMGWLAEQARFGHLAGGSHAEAILRINFEDVMASPAQSLAAIARHFGLVMEGVDAALASPWWSRYSKAGEHVYDDADRRHDLALAQQRFATGIARGERWVDAWIAVHPALTLDAVACRRGK
jgi:hypothetical protein